jgi:hypothetical protein
VFGVVEAGFLTDNEEGAMELWDSSGNKMHTFDVPMSFCAISTDATRIVTVSREGSIALWEVSGLH